MKVIAVYSLKGGVGKTTSCVNLAYHAAMDKQVTLLWDLDPQGAATFYYQLKPKVKEGIGDVLGKKSHLANYAQPTTYSNLDVIPADFSYRQLDLRLDNIKNSKAKLSKLLKGLETEYELVFIDCPPSITSLAEHIFHVADVVLFPIIPTTLASRAFFQVKKFFKKQKYDKTKLIPFFALVDSRKNMHKMTQLDFRIEYLETLNTIIPSSSIVEQMGNFRAPVSAYAPRAAASVAYQSLWKEVKQRINYPVGWG